MCIVKGSLYSGGVEKKILSDCPRHELHVSRVSCILAWLREYKIRCRACRWKEVSLRMTLKIAMGGKYKSAE